MGRPLFPELGIGLGLRSAHYSHILQNRPKTSWFEAISENYMESRMGAGGNALRTLSAIRRDYPVVLHGVSLSIGSTDPLDPQYLKRLAALAERFEPAWMSDHLCWTGVEGENLHDLMPLPFTSEALEHLVPRILNVQDVLKRRILLENVSSYLTYEHSEMTEWEFLAELCARADCGVLLDVNNVFVSSVNHGFDPLVYLRGIPADRVGQMHLAGHSRQGKVLIDTHDHPVSEPVWTLYEQAVKRFGKVSTLIEWDAEIPDFEVLEAEGTRAAMIQSRLHGEAQVRAAAKAL